MTRMTKKKAIAWIKQTENILMLSIVGSVLLAIILVVPIRAANPSQQTIDFIKFPGEIFFNLMKMCILPVIICSILSGVTAMDIRTSGKLGALSLAYYLSTTLLASLVGVCLVNVIRPGEFAQKPAESQAKHKSVSPIHAILDLFRNLFPENIVRATIQQIATTTRNISLNTENATSVLETTADYTDGSNYLGIIFFCIFFGFVLVTFGERGTPIVKTIHLLNDVCMKMMMLVIVVSPVGIFFLILSTLSAFPNLKTVMSSMGMMMLTTMVGLIVLWMVVYPCIYFLIVRKNPYIVIYRTFRATIYAFITCSSSATLPFTLRCCEEKLGVRKAVTRFMLPIGAIVNMDGTSIHEGAAALFIAQLNGIPLSFWQMLIISLMGALSSIACSTTPGSGIVILLVILTSAGLPTEDIGLFFMSDWIMSRVRTATNVLGDCFAVCVVGAICEKDLLSIEDRDVEEAENESTDGQTDDVKTLELLSHPV